MITTKAKIIENVMRLINFKGIVKMMALHPPRSKGFIPSWIKMQFTVTTELIQSKTVATIAKKGSNPVVHIIYLHGGAYVLEANFTHWLIVKKLLNNISCRVSVIDYPLAPEHNYLDTMGMLSEVYESLIREYPQDSFVVMGDSAGGGLALAFTQKLIKESKLTVPKGLVLVSPWLDLTLENPQMRDYEKQDMMLSYGFLEYSADKYAAGANKRNYLLSPITGSLKGLPNTLVLYGSRELFVPDIEKFQELAAKEGGDIKFMKFDGMQHDWIMFPIKEADRAIMEVRKFILKELMLKRVL